ncbi:Ras GEF [Moesziomyces antarcticus]|uniref:Ras GEF n=2 Tax=Pseudozyma antarctica TaxID=84753 RepID=A0A081CJV8_PSEA2|nr:Ras GEF [Moesziomyces antarcticus]GAK66954.1 Ras GEF [Moesziomyces antarcticus]SPO48006.1 related to aimless RasGEF (aleA) [Moesziomyces antarcticus]
MEDPLDTAAAKKKPAFAFWDRQRKDSHSTSPTMQRSSSSQHSAQPAAANTGLSGVQRLIQQYSQPNQAAASSSSSSALTPERSNSTSRHSPSSSRVSPSPIPPTTSSASTSSQTLDLLPNADTTKQAEAEKAKRRRRLLQDQLRKRNSNRRSSGPVDINSNSATLSSDEDDGEEEEEDSRIASESDSNPPSGSAPDSDAFHDASSRLVTPAKPSPSTAVQSRPPRQSLEDTRPWLEFSPLLPDSELLESPGKQATPSFALLHRSTPSDLSTPTSRSSATTDPPLLTSSARPSPSRSNSASMHASGSPASPTGLGLAAATSYLSLNSPTHSSHPRSYRNTKLPPPRPSPQAPLPPPPSEASSTHASPQPHAYSSRSAARPAPPIALNNDDADVFGGQTLRSRSYSLEQEVASADAQQRQHQHPQPTPPPDSAHTHAAAASSSSSLAVPIIRQRSNSLQRTQPDDSASASRPPRSASSSSTKPVGAGRPRGFTVGAVPAPPPSLRGGAPSSAPNKSRPRSLLSNEILPLDLAEPNYASSTDARKALSMDIDRRTASNRALTSASLSRGPSATSQAERDAASSSATTNTDRLQPDSTERRPSAGGRSRSGSSASLLQQVNSQPKSHASFVIAVVGHAQSGKSTVIKKGLRQFGLSKPHVLSEKVTSHSTVCVVDQEQRTIEVLEIDASVLLNGPSKRFAWPKFLPHIDAVILCYDAAEIASFRGMSELLENFAVANLSTVMLACKSEVHPKAVDPYYASDMACIYNVGLAECTVQSEEGKKRMRDCFSYLVKEVAKVRSGRSRRGTASTVPVMPAAAATQTPSQPLSSPTQPTMPSRTASATSHASSQADPADAAHAASLSPVVSADPRARGYSNASSSATRITTGGGESPGLQSTFPSDPKRDLASDASASAAASHDSRLSLRKMSSATAGSSTSDVPSLQSHDELGLHDSLHRAQMGLQNARATGGYVSIEELWDKLFHAAISRTDERFVTMFMVFYRGFATPLDLLRQMMARFDTLTAEAVADGLVHRFALIRLTSMLGDWVLDYPGDLSNAETHALLLRYHHQLLHHPDTVHTATQIQNAVEATARAPDLDALWSKAVNSDQTRHKGASAIAGDVDGGLSASHSSSSHLALATASGNTSHDMLDGDTLGAAAHDRSDTHERTGSESSLVMPPDAGVGGRSRSASDLTTSSTEAPAALLGSDDRAGVSMSSGVSSVSAHTQTSTGGSTTASGTATQASVSSTSTEALASTTGRALDQKAVLRSISNTLMEVDDEVIATELTRLEWAYFTAIQPRDLLRHILVPHDKRDGPVSRSISHFNYMSNWVCSMILAQGKTKHRARMLEKFFNIASILRHDNNYGSLNSVLGGLSKTAVHRLKHTRELLKGKAVNKAYQSLVRLMSNERSSAAYRLALENSDGPTIPYVGVHLQDILSISDGNPSKRAADGMIHWRKFSLMDEAVMAVARCQQYDRYIKPNAAVEKLIVDVPVMDDEALYERSLMVEPRASAGPVAASKIKDLKTFLSSQTYSSSSFHA